MDSLKDKAEELILLRKAKLKAYQKKYREVNKDKAKAYQKQWREEHKEKSKEYSKRYHQKHKDKHNESSREYNKKNKDKIACRQKTWREVNKEKLKKHRDDNKDNVYARNRKYVKYICDGYINTIIRIRGENPDAYTDEMKDIVRLQIQIKRELKTN